MVKSLRQFLDRSERLYGERLAFHQKRVFRLDKISYHQLLPRVQQMGTWLSRQQIKRGERVLIWAPNSPQWVVAYLGCLLYGVVAVPADVNSSRRLVAKFARQTKAKLLLTSIYITDRPKLKHINLEDLFVQLESLPQRKPGHINPGALAELIYTSGTTGEPKGVEISHGNLLAAINSLMPGIPAAKEYRLLSILPLSHILEQIIGLYAPLYYGATIYYLANPNVLTIKKSLRKYHITHFSVVPQILRLLWQAVELEAEKQGKSKRLMRGLRLSPLFPIRLRRFLFGELHAALGGELSILGCGSAPLDLEAAINWEKVGVTVLEGYGATETTGAVTINTLGENKLGSVGKVLTGIEVKLSPTGEILVKGPTVTGGYYLKPELDRESFLDGYYRTGDVGRFDRRGFLYITGREKFCIVTPSGDKVYPEEVEQQLKLHPAVIDCCLLGIPVAGGEVVALALILKTKAKLESVLADLNRWLEVKQRPGEVKVWPGADFPRTHTLKIDRGKVKNWFLGTAESGAVKPAFAADEFMSLLSRVAGFDLSGIDEKTPLGEALKLDSLKRATLSAFLEQEYGIYIADEKLSVPTQTVAGLRGLVKTGRTQPEKRLFPSWPRHTIAVFLRRQLRQFALFPLVRHFASIKIIGEQNLSLIQNPSILISNHVGNFDLALILAILPPKILDRQFSAADSWHYQNPARAQLLYWFGNAYSMVKDGSRAREELDFITDFIDQDWSLLITPEGEYGGEESMHRFRLGSALIAVETGAPVVPFKIENFDNIYKSVKKFPYWPDSRGEVVVKVGKPIIFDRNLSYQEVAQKMRQAIDAL